jgi:hypothetical protein
VVAIAGRSRRLHTYAFETGNRLFAFAEDVTQLIDPEYTKHSMDGIQLRGGRLKDLTMRPPASEPGAEHRLYREDRIRSDIGYISLAVHPKDRIVAVGRPALEGTLLRSSDCAHVELWDLDEGNILRRLEDRVGDSSKPELEVNLSGKALAFSPDGSLLAAGGSTPFVDDADAHVIIYSTTSGRAIAILTGQITEKRNDRERWVLQSAFDPTGRYVLAQQLGDIGTAWELETANRLFRAEGLCSLSPAAFGSSGRTLAARSYWKRCGIALLEFPSGQERTFISFPRTQAPTPLGFVGRTEALVLYYRRNKAGPQNANVAGEGDYRLDTVFGLLDCGSGSVTYEVEIPQMAPLLAATVSPLGEVRLVTGYRPAIGTASRESVIEFWRFVPSS